ncbi:MAG TPA: hypothetical protein VG860_19160 [Terriglobia bacterium]|jgi:hypothetical protein|nr:hypothetical protein [Terriglobia bacterium]
MQIRENRPIELEKDSKRPCGHGAARWLAVAMASMMLCGSRLGAQGDEPIREFESSKYRFKVQYPAAWFPLAGTSDILDITNFQRTPQVPGIALKVGGAEITVTGAPQGVRTPEQWVLRDLPDAAEVPKDFGAEQVEMPISDPAADGCRKIKRVSWRDEVAPEAYFAETNFYCSTGSSLYKIALSNWDGDRAQSKLRVIALQVALSLRTR